MVDRTQYNLTWAHFEELNPDKQAAFEKMCHSLFLHYFCDTGTILNSYPNHPGIEVEPVESSKYNGRISFQSKYCQRDTIYKEVKTSAEAIVKYYSGKVDKVFLFSNIDVTATSKNYVEIEKLLSDHDIELIPVTNQSILAKVLEYPAVLAHYYGAIKIDSEWIRHNLDHSLKILGKRYNPKFNIDTKPEMLLKLFIRDDDCVSYINSKKNKAIEFLTDVLEECSDEEKAFLRSLIKTVKEIEDVTMGTVMDSLEWERIVEGAIPEGINSHINNLNQEMSNLSRQDLGDEEYFNRRAKIHGRIKSLNSLMTFHKKVSFEKLEIALIQNQIVIINGEMGTGKSQLLSTTAKSLADKGKLVILMLGQMFVNDEPVEKQIISNLLDVPSNYTLDSLLGSMDEEAYRVHTFSFLIVDAINETPKKEIWKTGIIKLSKVLERYPNVRLIISLRNGFEKMCFENNTEDEIRDGKISSITHRGFADSSPDAVNEFMSHYGIPFSPEVYLQEEASNPLFLTWMCQTYNGKTRNVHSLIKAVIKKADAEASNECGSTESYQALKDLLYEINDFRKKNGRRDIKKKDILGLKTWGLFGITKKVNYLASLVRFGVLSDYSYNDEEIYYIGYNLLDEYLKAKNILDSSDDKTVVRGYASELLNDLDVDNESVFVMLASLYPAKFNEECIDLVNDIDEYDRARILDWYYRAFTWREKHPSLDQFRKIANDYDATQENMWGVFIENSTRTDSQLNAEGLHSLLMSYKLNRRDKVWTTYINELTSENRVVNLIYYLESGKQLDSVEEEKIELLLILFGWFLTASNRPLRDRTSKAMIEILKKRIGMCEKLLDGFKGVNDPYVIQRLYGVVFGAVMKRDGLYEKEYKSLASYVYKNVFDQEYVYPDVLLRDYARLIVERFAYEFPEKAKDFDLDKVRPPYKSEPIPHTEPGEYLCDERHPRGVSSILLSMKMDRNVQGYGLYGDFGRYVFQSALENFSKVDVDNAYYYAINYIFDQLGYTEEMFGEFDSAGHNPYILMVRYEGKKVERIGKKYQWIAMYNVVARISDTHDICSWGLPNNSYPFTGAWEPYVRDFDPTVNIRYPISVDTPEFELRKDNNAQFIAYDADEAAAAAWVKDNATLFEDLPSRFIRQDENGTPWVSLYVYDENTTRPDEERDHGFF